MKSTITTGVRSAISSRGLILQLASRDIASRYKNTSLGALWIIGQPILQLLLYAFVFRVVLQSRWEVTLANGSEAPFGLVLFVGILLHSLLADTLVRAPALIVGNTSFVKRVVFPIEILPIVNVASALVSVGAGLVIILLATLYFSGQVQPAVLLIPLPLAMLALMTLGLGWALAALGVFFRDLSQIMTNVTSLVLFTAPICYPASMVPARFRWLLELNPLTIPVESARTMMFGSGTIDWPALLAYGGCSAIVAAVGYVLFARMRRGFADAL